MVRVPTVVMISSQGMTFGQMAMAAGSAETAERLAMRNQIQYEGGCIINVARYW